MAELFQHISGLSKLQQQLDQLPANIEANLVRGGIRAGTKVMLDEVVRLAPEWTGRLKRGIRMSIRRRNGRVEGRITAGGRSKETMIITVNGRPKMVYVKPFWAKWVEQGTAAHRIVPKNKKTLVIGGLFAGADGVDHPGARPQPFMRPAFDGKWSMAVEAMADYVRGRLPRALRKYR